VRGALRRRREEVRIHGAFRGVDGTPRHTSECIMQRLGAVDDE
jgi:hypothetical protein